MRTRVVILLYTHVVGVPMMVCLVEGCALSRRTAKWKGTDRARRLRPQGLRSAPAPAPALARRPEASRGQGAGAQAPVRAGMSSLVPYSESDEGEEGSERDDGDNDRPETAAARQRSPPPRGSWPTRVFVPSESVIGREKGDDGWSMRGQRADASLFRCGGRRRPWAVETTGMRRRSPAALKVSSRASERGREGGEEEETDPKTGRSLSLSRSPSYGSCPDEPCTLRHA